MRASLSTLKNKFVKSTAVPGIDLTPRQLRAIGALMRGDSVKLAAKAAGTTREQIAKWLAADEVFIAEYQRQSTLLRRSLVTELIGLGSASASELHKVLKSRDPNRRLIAAKTGVTIAAPLVKSVVDAAEGVHVAPLFVLPVGTSVSLDVDIPSIPDSRASVVVDAELAPFLPPADDGTSDDGSGSV